MITAASSSGSGDEGKHCERRPQSLRADPLTPKVQRKHPAEDGVDRIGDMPHVEIDGVERVTQCHFGS
jgi:hypothetical protein